jgi:hypothetical protein
MYVYRSNKSQFKDKKESLMGHFHEKVYETIALNNVLDY